ncbi:MAG: ABC transporter ATP-binding protein [Clostridia bacterium]|nr:ABC transporter ATP-binding protein [Clostridia bacterium]
MKPLLKLEHIEVKFPIKRSLLEVIRNTPQKLVHAVNNISLEVAEGEILAIVGESGSGKTTLGKAVNALHDSDVVKGQITFNGQSIFDSKGKLLPEYRKDISMIFQDPYQSLNPKHTIEKIIAEPLMIHKVTKDKVEMRNLIIEALNHAGLSPGESFLNRYPHELSGGQRQRVVIASALVLNPKLIIADEPVSMLDVSVRSDILRLMMKLREEKKISYLFITHDISLAWAISDHIAVMYLGTMMEYGKADEVIEKPLNPYTQALINVMPKMHVRRNEKRVLLKGETPNPIDMPSGCSFHPRCPKAQSICKNVKPMPDWDKHGHMNYCHFNEEASHE